MIVDEIFKWEPFEYDKGRGSGIKKKDHEVYIYEHETGKSHHTMEAKMSSDLIKESGLKGKRVSISRDHEVFLIYPDENGKECVTRGGRFGGKGLAMALKKATGKTVFKGEARTDGSVMFK